MENRVIWIVILIGVLIFASQKPEIPETENGADLSDVIDSSVSFTAKDKFTLGTALTDESVRVMKLNSGNERKDLGYISLDSGALSTVPDDNYKFYYFMNTTPSTQYYVSVEEYTAPMQDAVDDRIGYGCGIDSSLHFVSYNVNGQAQSDTAYTQSVTIGETVQTNIQLQVSNNECYGMPDVDGANAICFAHNTSTAFSKIEINTKRVSTPSTISNAGEVSGKFVRCYEFPTLQDREFVNLPVNIVGGTTEPTTLTSIVVFTEDLAFDLNNDNLDEIYGYTDEDGNIIGANYSRVGTIFIT